MANHDFTGIIAQNQNQSQNYGQNDKIQQEIEPVTVIMVPLPAQGHLNQLLHLSRLVSAYGIPVHYACTPSHVRQAKARLQGWDLLSVSNLHFHEFQVPSYQTPPPNPDDPSKYPIHLLPAFQASVHLRQPVFSLMRKLSAESRRLVVIHDSLMPYVVQDADSVPNAESYCFNSISAFSIYCFVRGNDEGGESPELEMPLRRLPQNKIPDEMMEFVHKQVGVKVTKSGNLYNSCRAIEGQFLDLLAKRGKSDKHWAIGPFNPVAINHNSAKNGQYCLEWLDGQAPDSVIFVSFGSTISVTDEETSEIAIGLENSEQKFIWVVREADKGDVFDGGEVRKANLPEGFESRIQGRGIILRDWAPQLEILAHPSTGGFVSHCGWNSCMESISHGVPIAAWPMHSDQPANAVLISEVLRVGIMVRDWSEERQEIVTSKAVENAVRRLMDSAEGEEIRRQAKGLSEAVKVSVSSCLEMDSFVAHVRR